MQATSETVCVQRAQAFQFRRRPWLKGRYRKCTNEQKGHVLRAAAAELTGQAGVFHFINQLQYAILISQSQQDLKS